MKDQFDLWKELDEGAKQSRSRSELVSRIAELNSAACGYYKLSQCDNALRFYSQAYELSVKLGDVSLQAEYKKWQANCLRVLGRLTESLTCLVELEALEENPAEQFSGMMDQLAVAIMLPISLVKINSIFKRCSEFAENSGLRKSKSMIYINQAELHNCRKDYANELAAAQEAMASWDGLAYPCYIANAQYETLVDTYLDIGDRGSAELWLKRLEDLNTDFEANKELEILRIKCNFAFMDGDLKSAWEYAQRCLLKAREGIKNPFDHLKQYTEIAIECGHLHAARQAIAELLTFHRNSEIGHNRYELRRLTGDYHRAMAKQGGDSRYAHWHTEQARRFYYSAKDVGDMIDQRLQCDWHEKEIAERIMSLI